MASKAKSIARYIKAFDEIAKFVSESEDAMSDINEMSKSDVKEELFALVSGLKNIINETISEIKFDPIDEEISKDMIEEENTRNVPLEPHAKAKYILSRVKSDYERYKACRQYNINKGVNVKNKERIRYAYKMTIAEYYDFQRDFNFIRKQIEFNFKKHKPVFEEYYMKGLTLEGYAKVMGSKGGSRQYNIKWAFNKKESFIKALARAYANEMSSMTYYDGMQKEKGLCGRDLWAFEREIVSDALLEVDNGQIDYFEAMKNAYICIYEEVEKARREN